MRPPSHPPGILSWTMSDGYRLRGRYWPGNDGGGDVAVIYLHGIQSHGGWYEWSASKLAERGAAVLMPDRRGSGRNALNRGDVPDAERWLRDMDELAQWARETAGVRRLALVGVSWGGKLAALWAHERENDAATELLLIAPGLFPRVDLRWTRKLNVALSLVGGGRKMFDIPLSDPALFTTNPAGRSFITEDELKLSCVSGRFLLCSAKLDRRLVRIPDSGLSARCTLMVAGEDRIIRNDATERWLRRKAGAEPRVVVFERASHTIEFEADRRAFEDALTVWRDGLIKPQPQR